jgi:hypothetical protein
MRQRARRSAQTLGGRRKRGVSILGEILAQLLGEAAVDAMSKNKKPRVPFPEGEGNASLGAISLFCGALALLFSGLFFASTLDRLSFSDIGGPTILGIALITFVVALLAHRAGRRAPNFTRRHLGMALVGTYLALPAMVLSVATIGMCAARLLQWVQ